MKQNKEDYRQEWQDAGLDIDSEICTCNQCSMKDECDWAWDLFNYDGECLAEK